MIHVIKLRGTDRWPRADAKVLMTRTTDYFFGHGGYVAEIIYFYTYQGRYFSGRHEKPYVMLDDAKRYAAGFSKDSKIVVRLKPGDPETSIVRDEDQDLVSMETKDTI